MIVAVAVIVVARLNSTMFVRGYTDMGVIMKTVVVFFVHNCYNICGRSFNTTVYMYLLSLDAFT